MFRTLLIFDGKLPVLFSYCGRAGGLWNPILTAMTRANATLARPALKLPEFVALMALMTSLVAMSIDTMLPALPHIAQDLGVTELARTQMIISFLILGMGVGQLFFGPLSDSIGRKPCILMGLTCFVIGSLISMMAQSLEWMLIGRLAQGFGVSGPRVVSIALIRDQFVGRAMARVMSFIMMIFIIVPMLAPAVGQLIVKLSDWPMIFGVFILLAVIVGTWLGIRQPETLPREARRPFSWRGLAASAAIVLKTPSTMWLTCAAGLVFGGFLTYLSSSQAIFQDIYQVGDLFPLFFAMLAFAIGMASFTNGWLVMRFGTQVISFSALALFTGCFAVLLVLALLRQGVPHFIEFMTLGALGFFAIGLLFGNLNAMAMQPLGKVAGVGAAVVGSIRNFISVPLSVLVGQFYNATLVPLLVAFVLFGGLGLVCLYQGMRTHIDE